MNVVKVKIMQFVIIIIYCGVSVRRQHTVCFYGGMSAMLTSTKYCDVPYQRNTNWRYHVLVSA
jgi:hypothetical protein